MKNIVEFENVFDDADRKLIVKKIDNSEWKFGHSGIPETYRRFWFINLMDDPFFSKHLFDQIQYKIQAQCSLNRIFANGQTYGQDGDWHQDSIDRNEFTFIYYVNEEWKLDWKGETQFHTNNQIISFLPKHNKGILFPSHLSHCGSSPSRDCYKLRVTIAFFFAIKQWLK